ncbi:hypothetical protein NKH18_42935 [Streptomyces sp. M10(2022)]
MFAGDSTTTDHISPAGSIAQDSPAGRFLSDAGVRHAEYNSYGCRRGNHEVLIRGTFANIKFRNRLTPSLRGSHTVHTPTGRTMSVYDASTAYAASGTPSSWSRARTTASAVPGLGGQGPALLGVRAVLAQSFERIHRSNLIGMGIVPLEFSEGDSPDSLGLTGHEALDIIGLDGMSPRARSSYAPSTPRPGRSRSGPCGPASTPAVNSSTCARAAFSAPSRTPS